MTRRAADPHARFDEWLLAGARGEPARDLALHASLCAACTARISAVDLLTSVDPGRAPMPPLLAGGAHQPATALRRGGRFAAAFAGVTLAAALIGVAGWRLIELQGLAENVDANAGETPGQAVLGGTGESSQPASPEASVNAPSSAEPAATAGPTQTAGASAQPASQPVIQPGATPRPSTPRPSVSASPSASPAPSASSTPAPAGSPTPTPSGSETPVPSETASPTPEPSPGPDDCADGIDNDGDLLIDALDPGCLLDGDEASA
jgi:hypothetical protein